MEGYKERLLQEKKELCDKINKLENIIDKYYSGSLEFKLNCPIWLLEKQSDAMNEYYSILGAREYIEIGKDE